MKYLNNFNKNIYGFELEIIKQSEFFIDIKEYIPQQLSQSVSQNNGDIDKKKSIHILKFGQYIKPTLD